MEQPESMKKGRTKETLFRVTYRHQGHLIQIADYKANMIISICTMIISAIIAVIGYGVVTGKGEIYVPILIAPVLLIIFSCLISLIFAILAARPKFVSIGRDKKNDAKSSLLFFDVIARHTQAEYLQKMKDLLTNDEEVFEQMSMDVYNQGLVLYKKYNLLRNAYMVLLVGFVASVLLFLISFAFRS
jgi:hypothetical protein